MDKLVPNTTVYTCIHVHAHIHCTRLEVGIGQGVSNIRVSPTHRVIVT